MTADALATTMPMPCAPFDYKGVPADTAEALQAQAARIRAKVKNTTAIIIEVGNDLIAVKQAIDHGKFGAWIEAECGFSVRTAENYIRAAEFAEGKNATVAFLNPATVYRLAAKSAPADIVNAVIGRAEKGEVVSDRDVAAAMDEAKRLHREAERKAKQKPRPISKTTQRKYERENAAAEARERARASEIADAARGLVVSLGDEHAQHLIDALRLFTYSELDTFFRDFKAAVRERGGAA